MSVPTFRMNAPTFDADPTKLRQAEADAIARVQAYRGEPGLYAVAELLQLRLSKLDGQIRNCEIADFPKLQAKAKVYVDLIKDLQG